VEYEAGDENLYRYVKNNSTTNVDPTGLQFQRPSLPDGGMPRGPREPSRPGHWEIFFEVSFLDCESNSVEAGSGGWGTWFEVSFPVGGGIRAVGGSDNNWHCSIEVPVPDTGVGSIDARVNSDGWNVGGTITIGSGTINFCAGPGDWRILINVPTIRY